MPAETCPLIGVDLGGTKISAVILDANGTERIRHRIPAPQNDYDATLTAIRDLLMHVEQAAGMPEPATRHRVGLGTPGSTNPHTGLIQNANSTWLNAKPLQADLENVLQRRVRLANDANCLALSEASDGAAAGCGSVFAAILGTGVGGGLIIRDRLVNGPLGISGEWGHTPLPRDIDDPDSAPDCWCGRTGCIEAWLSGPALAAGHARISGEQISAEAVARADTPERKISMERYMARLARALATIVNIIDPHIIVLGGGLSRIETLYDALPALIMPHIFSDAPSVRVVPALHGDDSGVRGAARLWQLEET